MSQVIDSEREDPAKMAYAYKMTWIWAGCLSVVVFIIWPLMTLPAGVFSKSYFTFWIVLAMIWGFLAGQHPYIPLYWRLLLPLHAIPARAVGPGWRGAVYKLSTVPTIEWLLLGSGESNKR